MEWLNLLQWPTMVVTDRLRWWHRPGVLVAAPDDVDATLERFMVAIAKHRHFERESYPPRL